MVGQLGRDSIHFPSIPLGVNSIGLKTVGRPFRCLLRDIFRRISGVKSSLGVGLGRDLGGLKKPIELPPRGILGKCIESRPS